MPKNNNKQSNYKKILEAITTSLGPIKKYPSVPSINLPITAFLLQSKEISQFLQKEEETEYTIGNYLIKKTLGQGTFGKVKLGIYLPNKEKVAVKILEKERIIEKDDEIRVRREFDMLAKFNHPNVILVAEIFESSNSFYSVMEYCEGGELFNYIVKNQRLSEDEAAFFYYQLINGLEYIHSLGIVHRDLKPENLLLTNEHILKIIDFGLSNYFTKDPNQELLTTPCGSPCYASPEMVAGKKYNGFKIDIWATGIILYAMLCGYLPFEDKSNDALFKKILECKVKYPNYVGNKSKDLIKKILVNDPEKRITISQIKKHPFFLKGKNLFEQEFSLCPNSSTEVDIRLSNSNIILSNIEDYQESKDKENITIEKDKESENKKEDIEDNILLTLPQEAIYQPLKTEFADKSCQFYSDYQNSDQESNIAIEENVRNDIIFSEDKKELKNEEKNTIKKENMNKTNYIKNKTKNKETSLKKTLNNAKSKSKEFIHNGNIIKKNKENALKKANYRMLLKKKYTLKVHKTNTHSNLKKKGYSVGLNNIIKKYCNKKTAKKERPKLNININNINNMNNYINNDINKNIGIQITPYEKKKNKKMKSIEISKNNGTSEEKEKKYLKTDININKEKEKEKEKSYNKKYNNSNMISDIGEIKTKHLSKKLTNDIGLNININLNNKEKNKYYENDTFIANRRMKTETNNNINLEDDNKVKRTINSKNNTTVNTITNNSNANNSKNHKNNNNSKNMISNNQKANQVYKKKTKKKYVVELNGHKTRINIVACKRTKKNSKSIKKTTPRTNHKNINIMNKNIEMDKKKNSNIQIKTETINDTDNIMIIDKGLKTETDIQEKNINNKIKKNNIKSSSNVSKLSNLIEHNKYRRAFKLPIDNIIGKRNIKKNYSNNIKNSNNNSNNKSYNKIQKHKYTSTGIILKNTNISNFSTNNGEQKMKVNTNPNIANNKTKISSYNNIPRNKKELVTIRNTVINFNMVNSSLIISSLNKKRHSISNSFHFLNKKLNTKKSMNFNNNNQNHINRTLNNVNFIGGIIKKNKSNDKMNSINNYSTNTKKNKFKNKNIIITNIQKNNILNYSENVSKTENNEGPILKIKNKLEKILLSKLKQNMSQEKKQIKYNSVKLDEYNRNNIRKKKMLCKKTKFSKHNSNKCTTNSIFMINKSISPNNKNIKTISNSEINSNKLISVQKQNKNGNICQSENGQKRLIKKWTNS